MIGEEYLNIEVLKQSWNALNAELKEELKIYKGTVEFIMLSDNYNYR
ncbi:MAG: hypothetical protein ABIH71_04045 [Candidatus Omnitrophota bacterium]